jgi:anhydro-N-acetylmuramic acid kinase
MAQLYLGLMSGTSVNGIDAALVDLSDSTPKLIASHHHDMPADIRESALQLTQPQANELHKLYELDNRLGHLFADSALAVLKKANITADKVLAIGSHGQTIRHQPNNQYPYTVQIGDPNIIAARTGITTVADFRRRDIANGGQGAPFAPVFHAHVLSDQKENRAIVNIGGIANVTVLPAQSNQATQGFDTGPGNGLMDNWAQLHLNQPYDKDGAWAAEGKVQEALLTKLQLHPFFKLAPPKSTGRDHFNLQWLNTIEQISQFQPQDVQATLTELTAITIIDAIKNFSTPIDRIILCGGGVHNTYLVKRLQALSENIPVNISDEYGASADWMEAMLFAWLAQQTMQQKALDLTAVTGASKAAILGGIYFK